MVSPPGICEQCGYIGPVPGYNFTGRNITILDSYGQCPRCNGVTMRIVDGTYDFVGDVVRRVKDADLPAYRLREMGAQIKQDVSPDEFVAKN
jgi:hypothetical protein